MRAHPLGLPGAGHLAGETLMVGDPVRRRRGARGRAAGADRAVWQKLLCSAVSSTFGNFSCTSKLHALGRVLFEPILHIAKLSLHHQRSP